MKKRLIVALDFDNSKSTLDFLEKLDPNLCLVKVGLELFISEGWSILDSISNRGFEIFLDLKLHDIPNTVHKAVKKISRFNVSLTTIHLCGGEEMIAAANNAKGDIDILGVTILTSLSEKDVLEITSSDFNNYFDNLISIANNSDVNGIVCSPNELDVLQNFKKLKVVPGIRNFLSNDDQKRVMTSGEAYEKGADFIVVGRPITLADDPTKAIKLFV
tara:strand:- start:1157 stop:1807 length:651 start_codon:yes stop_codon:yes gene_type:complete